MSVHVFSSHEEVVDFLKQYEEETLSHFVSVTQTKNYDSKKQNGYTIKTKDIFRWELKAPENLIPFNGTPFVFMGKKTYSCHLGKEKTSDKLKTFEKSIQRRMEDSSFKGRRATLTKKLGCPAKIFVKRIARFPQVEYKIENEDNTRCHRDQVTKKLRGHLEEVSKGRKMVLIQEEFWVFMPDPSAHEGHVFGQVSSKEPVDERVQKKALSLISRGVSKVGELGPLLYDYVVNELFQGMDPPDPSRRRYYPHKKDLSNFITKARRQSNLNLTEMDTEYEDSQIDNEFGAENVQECIELTTSQDQMEDILITFTEDSDVQPLTCQLNTNHTIRSHLKDIVTMLDFISDENDSKDILTKVTELHYFMISKCPKDSVTILDDGQIKRRRKKKKVKRLTKPVVKKAKTNTAPGFQSPLILPVDHQDYAVRASPKKNAVGCSTTIVIGDVMSIAPSEI